jgi:hypothetical protein
MIALFSIISSLGLMATLPQKELSNINENIDGNKLVGKL